VTLETVTIETDESELRRERRHDLTPWGPSSLMRVQKATIQLLPELPEGDPLQRDFFAASMMTERDTGML
jgi:hypothetical protein